MTFMGRLPAGADSYTGGWQNVVPEQVWTAIFLEPM